MSAITKQAAVSQMVAYIEYLTNHAPLGQKFAAQQRNATLVTELQATGNLQQAIKKAYPEKTASDRVIMAVRLIRGLSQKRAAAQKKAMGGMGMAPAGSTSGAMNVGAGAQAMGTQGMSAQRPSRGLGQTSMPQQANPSPGPSRFSGSMFSMPTGASRAPSGSSMRPAGAMAGAGSGMGSM